MLSVTARRSILLSTLVIAGIILNLSPHASADTDLSEEKLNTESALRWGGEGLPFDKVVTIRDPLVNSIVGKVIIDRHGEDDNMNNQPSGMLSGLFTSVSKTFQAPFTGPRPGRLAIVTLWGSKEEGCFVKASIHNSPKGRSKNAQGLVPIKMEVGVGSQVIKFTSTSQSAPKFASSEYTYTDYTNKKKIDLNLNEGGVKKSAMMYFTENTFAINGKVADLLRNAPKGNAKVRLTFANGDTKIFPIGEKNVARWKDAYSYNPNCTAAK